MISALASIALAHQASQAPTAEELLAKMQFAYARARTALLFVHFEATDPSGFTAKGDVRFEFLSPNRVRAGFKGLPNGAVLLVCDGKKIALLSGKGKQQVVAYSPTNLGRHLPTNLETIAFYDGAHELSTGKGGGMNGSKLEVLPNVEWNHRQWEVLRETSDEDQVRVDYYVDPKTSLIWRTLGEDLRTKKPFVDCQVQELELNANIPAERFAIPGKHS